MNTWLFRLFADYVKIDWCTYLISDCGGCKDRARICSETSHRSTVRRFAVYRKPDCSRRYTQSPRHREPHHLVRMMLLRPPQQRPLLLSHSIAGRIGTGQCSSAQGSLRGWVCLIDNTNVSSFFVKTLPIVEYEFILPFHSLYGIWTRRYVTATFYTYGMNTEKNQPRVCTDNDEITIKSTKKRQATYWNVYKHDNKAPSKTINSQKTITNSRNCAGNIQYFILYETFYDLLKYVTMENSVGVTQNMLDWYFR